MSPLRIVRGRVAVKGDASGIRPTDAGVREAPPSAAPPHGTAPKSGLTSLDAQLTAAARVKKSDGPEGSEPLLGPTQARRARAVWASCSPKTRTALDDLLRALDGNAAPVARALLLRAIAARATALVDAQAPAALKALKAFCEAMDGLSAQALRARATVLDLDSTRNSSGADPQVLWDTRGVVRDARAVDDSADNDGLFQRFTGACGPTAVQMMLAENDPVLAFALHDAGLHSDSTTDAGATLQRQLLEHYGGGKSLGRVEAWLRARVHNGLGRLRREDLIDDGARRALDAHLFQGGPLDGAAERALSALRARWHFPSDAEVARLRERRWPQSDDGITTAALLEIINQRFGATLGLQLEAREFAKGHVWRHLDDVARALKSGVDVPFGCSDPGHWMLLTAVKGRKPHRHLLVSDPDGGRTLWVAERNFTRGTFLTEDLHLARPGQQPWVDAFLLPATPKGARP